MIFILESQCDELVGVAGGVAGVWSVWCVSAAAEGHHVHLPSKDKTWQHTVPTVPAFPTALFLRCSSNEHNNYVVCSLQDIFIVHGRTFDDRSMYYVFTRSLGLRVLSTVMTASFASCMYVLLLPGT